MPAKSAKAKRVKKKSKVTVASPKREILFAPWRYTYIKASDKNLEGTCVFCAALKKGPSFESLILFKGESCSIFLNKYPYNNGHLMVIPHRHTAEFHGLDASEFADLHAVLRRAHDALLEVYKPQGMNIGMNLGRVAGAGIVDHLHYHLVPRWGGDTNFMPIVGGTKVISENLEQTYEKLLPLFR